MKNLILLAAILLAGCVSMTEVQPVGQGRYMLGTTVRGGFAGDSEVKASIVRRATAYCAERSKTMTLESSASSGMQGWTPQNAEVIFKCE